MLLSIKKENPLPSKSWSTLKEKQHVLAEKRGEGGRTKGWEQRKTWRKKQQCCSVTKGNTVLKRNKHNITWGNKNSLINYLYNLHQQLHQWKKQGEKRKSSQLESALDFHQNIWLSPIMCFWLATLPSNKGKQEWQKEQTDLLEVVTAFKAVFQSVSCASPGAYGTLHFCAWIITTTTPLKYTHAPIPLCKYLPWVLTLSNVQNCTFYVIFRTNTDFFF